MGNKKRKSLETITLDNWWNPENWDKASETTKQWREDDINWLDNWLHNRIPQMANNVSDYYNSDYDDSNHHPYGYGFTSKLDNSITGDLATPPLYPLLKVGTMFPKFNNTSFMQNNREKLAKNIIDKQISYIKNNTNIFDLRDPKVFGNLGNNNPFVIDFGNRTNPRVENSGNWLGMFYPRVKNRETKGNIVIGEQDLKYSPIGKNNLASFLHEATHAATEEYPIQESTIARILKENKDNLYQSNLPDYIKDKLDYYTTPTEIYSRMMEVRKLNKLDPKTKITKDILNEWRKDPNFIDHDVINLFSNDVLLKLFNDVANNGNLKDFRQNFANIAALGEPSNKKERGGRKSLETIYEEDFDPDYNHIPMVEVIGNYKRKPVRSFNYNNYINHYNDSPVKIEPIKHSIALPFAIANSNRKSLVNNYGIQSINNKEPINLLDLIMLKSLMK